MNPMTVMRGACLAALTMMAMPSAMAQAIKVVNVDPNFGYKITSAQVNGDANCAKMGFDKIVVDPKGTIEIHTRNQGVMTKSSYRQPSAQDDVESITCNLVMSYQTDDKTKITPTEGRSYGTASLARGHKVAVRSVVKTKTSDPVVSEQESPTAIFPIKVKLETFPTKDVGAPIPCGTKDTVTTKITIALKGSGSDKSEIRLSSDKTTDGGTRLFSSSKFTAGGC